MLVIYMPSRTWNFSLRPTYMCECTVSSQYQHYFTCTLMVHPEQSSLVYIRDEVEQLTTLMYDSTAGWVVFLNSSQINTFVPRGFLVWLMNLTFVLPISGYSILRWYRFTVIVFFRFIIIRFYCFPVISTSETNFLAIIRGICLDKE
jgi:hypothetical protein